MTVQPGKVVLLGSGETAPSIRKVYDWLFKKLDMSPRVTVLETPAGFEPNSDKVAQRIADFLSHRLQNYHPEVTTVPARKRDTNHSPDDPRLIAPLRTADVMFMGPGSPTYAVRQLQDTLAWHTMMARHRMGASLILASASTLAISAHTLPVYEIYKVGEELHWQLGLDFLGLYGLSLVFIPHWNNTEGGDDLDTSRCYMGQARFERLQKLLPPRQTIVGIDEHTALVLDLAGQQGRVMGKGSVTLITPAGQKTFQAGQPFDIGQLGQLTIPAPRNMVPGQVWADVERAQQQATNAAAPEPSTEVLDWLAQRQAARQRKDWPTADKLRDQLAEAGWQVNDTPTGPELEWVGE